MAAIRFRQTAPSRLPTPSLIISPLAIALIALAQAGEARGEPYHEDHAFRKTYKSYLDYDTILKAPAWDQEIDRPPVLARKAIKLADKMRDSVATPPKDWKSTVKSLYLNFAEEGLCVWHIMQVAEQIERSPIDSGFTK